MEFHHSEICDTGLVLGLSLSSSPSMSHLNTMDSTKHTNFEPSLTLSLAGVGDDNIDVLHRQDSAVISGGASSFSNKSSKREREDGSEDSERVPNDNNCSRVMSATSVDDGEDDDDCANGRKKLRLTKPQSALLEQAFKHHSSLNPKQKQELARELKLRPRQVEVWFQNRRARSSSYLQLSSRLLINQVYY